MISSNSGSSLAGLTISSTEGAIQNRLGHSISVLNIEVINTSAAQSRIEDTDYSTEASKLAQAHCPKKLITIQNELGKEFVLSKSDSKRESRKKSKSIA